jgi:ABC-2 type transporter
MLLSSATMLQLPNNRAFRQYFLKAALHGSLSRLLLSRSWRQATRDKATNFARAGTNISSALIFGSIYFRMRRTQSTVQDRIGLLQVLPLVITCMLMDVDMIKMRKGRQCPEHMMMLADARAGVSNQCSDVQPGEDSQRVPAGAHHRHPGALQEGT